jgi:hypothetical protein
MMLVCQKCPLVADLAFPVPGLLERRLDAGFVEGRGIHLQADLLIAVDSNGRYAR